MQNRVTIRLDSTLREETEKLAGFFDLSLSDYIRGALYTYNKLHIEKANKKLQKRKEFQKDKLLAFPKRVNDN